MQRGYYIPPSDSRLPAAWVEDEHATRAWPTLPGTRIRLRPRHYYASGFWSLIIAAETLTTWFWFPFAWQVFVVVDIGLLALIAFVNWCYAVDNPNR